MYLIQYVIIVINATKLSATTSLISKVKYSSQVNLNPSCIRIAIDLKRVSFECIVLFLMVNQCVLQHSPFPLQVLKTEIQRKQVARIRLGFCSELVCFN